MMNKEFRKPCGGHRIPYQQYHVAVVSGKRDETLDDQHMKRTPY